MSLISSTALALVLAASMLDQTFGGHLEARIIAALKHLWRRS